jgi:hypothetical protein
MKTILLSMTALAAIAIATPAAAQPWSGQHSGTGQLQIQLDEGMRTGMISRREAMPLRNSLRQLVSLERQFSRNGFTGRENAALRQRSNTLGRQIRLAARTGIALNSGRDWQRDGDPDRDGKADRNERSDRRDGERDGNWSDRRDGERDSRWSDSRDGERDSRWSDRRDNDDSNSRSDRSNRGERSDRSDNDRDNNWSDGRRSYGADARFDGPNRGDRFAGDARIGTPATLRMMPLPDQYREQFRDSDDVYYRFDTGRIYRINRSTNMVLALFDIAG